MELVTVCALRVFGFHKVELGSGAHGSELDRCLRWKFRTGEEKLWKNNVRNPIDNRIEEAASCGWIRNITGDSADETAATPADCLALDAQRRKPHRRGGEKANLLITNRIIPLVVLHHTGSGYAYFFYFTGKAMVKNVNTPPTNDTGSGKRNRSYPPLLC